LAAPDLRTGSEAPARRAHAIAVLQVGAGAVLISFSAVFVKLARVSASTAAFYRVLCGGVVLVVLAFCLGGTFWRGRRRFALALLCGAAFAADLALWHRSIHLVGPGLSSVLANLQVFFLAGFGVLVLREKLPWQLALAIPLAVFGLYFIVGREWAEFGAGYKRGIIYGVGTAVCYAAYILTLRRLQTGAGRADQVAALAVVSLMAAGFLGWTVAAEGGTLAVPDSRNVAVLVAYGVCSQVLGWVLISGGLPRITAAQAGLILLMQPTLAFTWDILFFGRPTTALDALGAALVLAGIYLGSARNKR